MDINEATSRVLSAERSAAHLTIKELCLQAEIPERTLIRVLKGERDINVQQLAKLAPVFGLYPHEIIESAEKLIERSERGKVPDYLEEADTPASAIDDAEAVLATADNGIDIDTLANEFRADDEIRAACERVAEEDTDSERA